MTTKVTVAAKGIQGPPGLEGPTGEPANYIHEQAIPMTAWTITHNLGFRPNVTVVDSAGSMVEGDLTYNNANQLTIEFAGAFSGFAYLS